MLHVLKDLIKFSIAGLVLLSAGFLGAVSGYVLLQLITGTL